MASFDFDHGLAEVVSLPAPQVQRLIYSLRLHREKLQVGHEDSTRLAFSSLRPGYLLDFDLIFAFVFQPEDRQDWTLEMTHLFRRSFTTFIIGPGTHYEIRQFLRSAGFVLGEAGPEDLYASGSEDRHTYGLDQDTIAAGLERLSQLLKLFNVVHFSDLLPGWTPNEEVFETAKTSLDALRRKATPHLNRADALNWAAVVDLRQSDIESTFYPYLLTGTRAILKATASRSELADPISRSPAEAIYTEVLLDLFDDPVEAANHTIRMAVNAARLEKELRQTPAFRSPEQFQAEPAWELAVERHLVTENLREQLEQLAKFLSDPVVNETQRIYDNTRLRTANLEQQRGSAVGGLPESPRKLFDLIVEVSAALSARSDADLGELWELILDVVSYQQDEQTTYELLERSSLNRRMRYLVAERHEMDEASVDEPPGGSRHQFTLRWPSSLDADAVITSFSRAYSRHEVDTVDLTVGTDHAVEFFGARLPISLEDIMSVVCEECTRDSHGSAPAQLHWIRMSAGIFELYADISPPDLAREPLIGVFVDQLNPEHLEELYARTAARYLLPIWFRNALNAVKAERWG